MVYYAKGRSKLTLRHKLERGVAVVCGLATVMHFQWSWAYAKEQRRLHGEDPVELQTVMERLGIRGQQENREADSSGPSSTANSANATVAAAVTTK